MNPTFNETCRLKIIQPLEQNSSNVWKSDMISGTHDVTSKKLP